METVTQAFGHAFTLIASWDGRIAVIVGLTVEVSLAAVAIALVAGLPLGAAVAVSRFRGRASVIVVLNALMGLPSVVVGLLVYLVLSRAGPLGSYGILFTPPAMIIAQAFLVLPIVAALARQIVEDAWLEYGEQLRSLGATPTRAAFTLLWDTRFAMFTVALAGLGRALTEVGAALMVGGNIDGVTRIMTTAIALETAKGDLPLALGLGFVLMTLVLALNAGADILKGLVQHRSH
jgi:tungstate transport system permease protein